MPDYSTFLAQIYEVLRPLAKPGVTLGEDSELVSELGLTFAAGDGTDRADRGPISKSRCRSISCPDIRTVRDLAAQLEKLLT